MGELSGGKGIRKGVTRNCTTPILLQSAHTCIFVAKLACKDNSYNNVCAPMCAPSLDSYIFQRLHPWPQDVRDLARFNSF